MVGAAGPAERNTAATVQPGRPRRGRHRRPAGRRPGLRRRGGGAADAAAVFARLPRLPPPGPPLDERRQPDADLVEDDQRERLQAHGHRVAREERRDHRGETTIAYRRFDRSCFGVTIPARVAARMPTGTWKISPMASMMSDANFR